VNEFELIKNSIKGDELCQKALFERFAGKMMTVCRRYAIDEMEAEDMMQDGFIRMFNKLDQFKFQGSFEGWLRRIMVNTAIRHCQRRKITYDESSLSKSENINEEPVVYDGLNEEEILKLIAQLPNGYRMVFNLYVIEGYSHDEIANMLKIEAGTSRSQLVKARKLLQQAIINMQKVVL
jgi:RNA polymerase sigma-70 factor (ECF subfamily)